MPGAALISKFPDGVPGAVISPKFPGGGGGKKLEGSPLRRRLAAGCTGGRLQPSGEIQAFWREGVGDESKPEAPRSLESVKPDAPQSQGSQGVFPASQAERRMAELEEALAAAGGKILEMQDQLTQQDALLRIHGTASPSWK